MCVWGGGGGLGGGGEGVEGGSDDSFSGRQLCQNYFYFSEKGSTLK